ncbi:unnamed protein product [Cunninghamella blakesleeana]
MKDTQLIQAPQVRKTRKTDKVKQRLRQVYVSKDCHFESEPISSRDANNNKLMKQIKKASNLISLLKNTEKSICLIVVDYAGLVTEFNDLFELFWKYEKLKMVIVDLLSLKNKVEKIERDQALNDPSILSSFDCRPPRQRAIQILSSSSTSFLI